MTEYNWNERHIITFPEETIALATKDLHVYYGSKEAIKGIDMQFEKINYSPNWTLRLWQVNLSAQPQSHE